MINTRRAIMWTSTIALLSFAARSTGKNPLLCLAADKSRFVEFKLGYNEMYLFSKRGSGELIVVSGFRDPVLIAARSHFVFWKLQSLSALQDAWRANSMENFGLPPKVPADSENVLRSVQASDKTFQDAFEVFGVNLRIYTDSFVAVIEVDSNQIASSLKLDNPPKSSKISEKDFKLTRPKD